LKYSRKRQVGVASPYQILHLAFQEIPMSGSISPSFPQAPLAVPQPLARAKPLQIDTDGDTDGSAAEKVKAPVAQNTEAKSVVPSNPTGGMVNLRA